MTPWWRSLARGLVSTLWPEAAVPFASVWWRSLVRGLVITGGAAVILASLLSFEPASWPVYLAYFAIAMVLYPPVVQVLPGLVIGVPSVAAGIGFLYIAGLPIIVLNLVAVLVIRAGRSALPRPWLARVPPLAALAARRDLGGGGSQLLSEFVPESATYALGLGMRWAVVSQLAGSTPPSAAPWAMAAAEACGYAVWAALSILPIYPDRTLLPLADREGLRSAIADMRLIFPLALTPSVYLIAYGYQTGGLTGATGWALATLGLHLMLRRMNERRLMLEEQNRQLVSLNRELEHRERLSAIGKMSSLVSHQILQQLGVIGLYAELIRNADGQGDPAAAAAQARSSAGAIETALGDVNRVLTDLLVFSKDLRLNLYSHALVPLLEECVEACRAPADERRVTLRLQGAAPPELTLDKLKMKQAFVNLLRNAIDASPAGGAVVVEVAQRDGGVAVAVCDQGPGVPAGDREAVFAPFFTTKERGTGLGLAIARQFTEAHGGRLWVEAAGEGTGARFVTWLPLTADGRA
jgi:signal transduction histidine kinase